MNEDKDREAFELVATEDKLALNRHRHSYASTSTAIAWDFWQAALKYARGQAELQVLKGKI